MCSSPLERAPKLQLAEEQPLTGGCWNPPKRDPIQGEEAAIMTKPNPTPTKVDDSQAREKYQRSSPTVEGF